MQISRHVRGAGRLAACVALVTAIVLSGTAQAEREVYRWVDDQGNVIFSDTPPSRDTSKVAVKSSPSRPLDKDAEPDTQEKPAAEAVDAEQAEATQQEAAAMQELRAKNCERARNNLVKLNTARRVYDPLPNGERRYLSDDDLAARKIESQADVQRWCN